MNPIIELITRQLGASGGLDQLGDQIGADRGSTQSAVMAALPVLIAALSRNAASPQGATALNNALQRDHDGSVLNDLGGLLGNIAGGPGGAILKHILGAQQPAVQSGLGRATGLDAASVGTLLSALAPLVMGALGQQSRQQNLNPTQLSDLLKGQVSQAQAVQPGLLGGLNRLLDADGDGSAVNDIAKGLSTLFGPR